MLNQDFRRKLKATKIPDVCRYVIAVIFIISGFVKTIDPWGTTLKMQEYLMMLGLDFLLGCKEALAIWLCAAEMMMGCMLMFRVRLRLISVFSVVSMTVFTFLTLYMAIYTPIEDCGCFGAAIKLTPWQSFFKNLILWPMSAIMWWTERDRRFFPFTMREGVLTLVFMFGSGLLGVYCYRHLPIIDLLPFKEGVNLRAELADKEPEEIKTIVKCKNLQSGEIVNFAMDDPTWYDTEVWEFVDTWVEGATKRSRSVDITINDFVLFDNYGDVTASVLADEGTTYLLCIQTTDKLNERIYKKFTELIEYAESQGNKVACVTASAVEDNVLHIGGYDVSCYNMDDSALNILMRSKAGVITLYDGVIQDKCSFRDIKVKK